MKEHKYFDFEASITAYEAFQGKTMSDNAKQMIRAAGDAINEAYEAGFRDGKEAAQDA